MSDRAICFHDCQGLRSYFKVVKISGRDGSCLFRSALFLHLNEMPDVREVKNLRKDIGEAGLMTMKEGKQRATNWIESEVATGSSTRDMREKNVLDYFTQIKSGKAWGDHRCLQLIANHLNKPIHVYVRMTHSSSLSPLRAFAVQPLITEPILPDYFDSSDCSVNALNLIFTDNKDLTQVEYQGHYDALVPTIDVDFPTQKHLPPSANACAESDPLLLSLSSPSSPPPLTHASSLNELNSHSVIVKPSLSSLIHASPDTKQIPSFFSPSTSTSTRRHEQTSGNEKKQIMN